MGEIRWYKRDPVAWIHGTRQLSLEERGAYNDIIELIMSHDGRLEDDDQNIAGWLRCHWRTWKAIKRRLVDAGKIVVDSGYITNARCTKEAASALAIITNAASAGRESGLKRSSRWSQEGAQDGAQDGLKRVLKTGSRPAQDSTSGQHKCEKSTTYIERPFPESSEPPTTTSTTTSREEEVYTPPPPHAGPPVGGGVGESNFGDGRGHGADLVLFGEDEDETSMPAVGTPERSALDAWNDLADDLGLPRVQILSKARKAKLRLRLRESGGLSGWNAALGKIRDIPGLQGDNDKGWRANFDWLLQPSSFAKLKEGVYDRWRSRVAHRKSKADVVMELLEAEHDGFS